MASEAKSQKKEVPLRYPFNSVEKNHNRKSLESKFQPKIQIAISGTENTETGNITPKIYFGSIISDRQKELEYIGIHNRRRDYTEKPSLSSRPRRKYCTWDEVLPDIFNGKLRIVRNKRAETDTEDEGDDIDEDDEEKPDEVGKRDGTYAPIRTDPENDFIQLHLDGEIPQGEEESTNKIGRSDRNTNKPDTVA